jgi:hypothetical protein
MMVELEMMRGPCSSASSPSAATGSLAVALAGVLALASCPGVSNVPSCAGADESADAGCGERDPLDGPNCKPATQPSAMAATMTTASFIPVPPKLIPL